MEVAIETITPETAREMLENNPGNRKLRPHKVRDYSEDMKGGRWTQNGDTILFNGNSLLDGQHRLAAIVRSETSQEMLVVRGLPKEVQSTVDMGMLLTKSDVLEIAGEKNVNRLGALLGFLWGHFTPNQTCYHGKLPNNRTMEALERWPDARSVPGMVPRTKLCAQRIMDGCFYLFRQMDPEMAKDYIMALIEGVGLNHGHPALTVRNRLMESRTVESKKMSNHDKVILIIKGWNAFRKGRQVTRFRINKGDKIPPIT